MDNREFEEWKFGQTAYAIIASVAGLQHVERNVFVDARGRRYYLDKFGFHTSIQHSSHELNRRNDVLEKAIKKYNSLDAHDVIGLKTRKKIRSIIAQTHLSETEKLELIGEVVKEIP